MGPRREIEGSVILPSRKLRLVEEEAQLADLLRPNPKTSRTFPASSTRSEDVLQGLPAPSPTP